MQDYKKKRQSAEHGLNRAFKFIVQFFNQIQFFDHHLCPVVDTKSQTGNGSSQDCM